MRPTQVVYAAAKTREKKLSSAVQNLLDKDGYPVARQLYESFISRDDADARLQSSRARKLTRRSDIVSEELCDDIIQLLAPTLEQHKGATIIDVNPGPCLWSSRIHDFLQPRCHLLMEPDRQYYEPFIKPLLEKPGSKYTYAKLTGAHESSYWPNYTKVMNDPTLMPPRPRLEENDPRLRKLDPSLLVIGNLWRTSSTKAYKVNLAPLVLQHMTYGALANEIFQQAGLVRMLWWMPEDNLSEMMPGNAMLRCALGQGLDIGAEMVQIAGNQTREALASALRLRQRRLPILTDIAKAQAVKASVDTHVPVSTARPNLYESKETSAEIASTYPDPLATKLADFQELKELAIKLKDKLLRFDSHVKARTAAVTPADVLLAAKQKLVYPQLGKVVEQLPNVVNGTLPMKSQYTILRLLDLYLEILNLEAEFAALLERFPDYADATAIRERIVELAKIWDKWMNEAATADVFRQLRFISQPLHATYARPALLSIDRKPFEPLKIFKKETWPQQSMALLMLTPNSHDFAIPGVVSRKEGSQVCQELIRHLFTFSNQPLPIVLDRIAPNAGRDLIAQVPAIVDARRNGRLDPMMVKPRSLSDEMVAGLVHAFLRWPFRPSKVQLMLANTSDQRGESEELDDDK